MIRRAHRIQPRIAHLVLQGHLREMLIIGDDLPRRWLGSQVGPDVGPSTRRARTFARRRFCPISPIRRRRTRLRAPKHRSKPQFSGAQFAQKRAAVDFGGATPMTSRHLRAVKKRVKKAFALLLVGTVSYRT